MQESPALTQLLGKSFVSLLLAVLAMLQWPDITGECRSATRHAQFVSANPDAPSGKIPVLDHAHDWAPGFEMQDSDSELSGKESPAIVVAIQTPPPSTQTEALTPLVPALALPSVASAPRSSRAPPRPAA